MRTLPLFLLFLAACAPQHPAYELRSRTLLPPGVRNADLQIAKLTIPANKPCRAPDGPIRIDQHGRNLRLTIPREALAGLDDWAASLAEQGCIPSAPLLAGQIRESLPVPLSSPSGQPDSITLLPGQRLKTVSPIPFGRPVKLESVSGSGNSLSMTVKSDLAGYQIAWWTVERDGLHFASAESHIGNQVANADHPDFPLHVAVGAKPVRISYLTRVSQSDHNAILIAADSQAIPAEVGISVYTRIIAKGQPLDVSAPATVAGALRTAGAGNVLPTLSIRRTHRGRLIPVNFDRTKPDILALPLLGGEELNW